MPRNEDIGQVSASLLGHLRSFLFVAACPHDALSAEHIVPSTQHVRMQLQAPASRHSQSAVFTWLHPRCTQTTPQQHQSCHQLPHQLDGAGSLQQPLKRQRRSSAWRGCSVQAYSAPAIADIISRVSP